MSGNANPFERFREADPLLAAIFESAAGDRDDALAAIRAVDPELGRTLDGLRSLAEQEDWLLVEGGALGGGLGEALAGEPEEPAPAPAGKRVGPWKIVRELGRGGMAVVYLAERADGAYEQRVALKLLHAGADAVGLVRRFERERQILASLKHPDIAGLIDGGLTEDGQPWFSMEHVEGDRIDRYCDRHRLTIEQRLRLFIRVARAVHAAHRALVVHRDLKPSNILVTEEGEPRLLDFGIAKALVPQGGEAVTRTVPMLTPEYASPEQVANIPVTTASDVYQLGLLLFELLTGERARRVGTVAELERVVLEQPVLPPSAVASAGGTAATHAEARQTTASGLARLLRGDLDAIVLQALRKEPERRYASVADLIEDLERLMAGRPVRARPDSWHYRSGRLLRRHRQAITGAMAAAALLAALGAGMLAVARSDSERVNADLERAEALRLLRQGQEAMRRATCDSEALALFERAIEKAPSLIAARVDRGWASYGQVTWCGRGYAYTRQALEDARAAQALDPAYADAWLLEASILTETGRAEEAFERIREGSRGQADAVELHFGAAYAATYSGYLDLAAAELNRTLEIEPGYLVRGGWTPNAYLYRGEFEKFLELLPREQSAYNQFYRAWAHVLMGQPRTALELLERVRDADPVDVFARLDRALVAVLSGDAPLGRDIVRELARQRLEHRAGDGELTFKQAQVLALAGLTAEAASQLRLAVTQGFFCPACIEADRALARLAGEPDYAAALDAARRRHDSFGRRFGLGPAADRTSFLLRPE